MSGQNLVKLYQTLRDSHGHQGWWPAEGWFETIAGAILAQNVSWTGASKAVAALQQSCLLNPQALLDAGAETIAPLIHSSRYYNQKAKKLLVFSDWFIRTYKGDQAAICSQQTGLLRREILNLKGFGPETVDSILLYACEKPVFVVDAYTRRIGSRFGWCSEEATYEEMQDFFMEKLNPDIDLFKDFHAQIVRLGNQICRKTPDCDRCPIRMVSEEMRCSYAAKSGQLSARK